MEPQPDTERLKRVKVGQVVDTEWGRFTAVPACDNKNAGRWYCITHKKKFDNQLQKDTHIHSGKHVLAWLCCAHPGDDVHLEVP